MSRRDLRWPLLLAILLGAVAAPQLRAQPEDDDPQQPARKVDVARVDKVQVGYRAFRQDDIHSLYKVGLWAPVYVEISAGKNGVGQDKKSEDKCFLQIESVDSEDIGTVSRMPVKIAPNEKKTFLTYVKQGHVGANVRATLFVDGMSFQGPNENHNPLGVQAQVNVMLGRKFADLGKIADLKRPGGMFNLNPDDAMFLNDRELGNLAIGFESDVSRLPDQWIGYNTVDLLILTTDSKEFLLSLGKNSNAARLKALSQWVRRGGRLVVPVNWTNQAEVVDLLQSPLWQPPISVVPPRDAGDVRKKPLESWAVMAGWADVPAAHTQVNEARSILIAPLDPGNAPEGDLETLQRSSDGRPLVTRVRYGMGQIVFLAFSFENPEFKSWTGKQFFLKGMMANLAPRVTGPRGDENFGRGRFQAVNDLASDLLGHLDNFDVRVIPFGYVALFIVLYILVVGPLDFFLLKYVFKRLEWTWITFPSVVVLVSVVAYFAAYALKGQDLKVNKIDIVDFDLRTELDAKRETRRAFVSGQTFFTILSPRIQNYTVGIEPNPLFWGDSKAEQPLSADALGWMGRPGQNDPFSMNRGGAQGFFRRPYQHANDFSGLTGVPIPVWTTKAFTASWSAVANRVPFKASLAYHQKQAGDRELLLSGTFENQLAVDLDDVWLIYDKQCYPLEKPLPAGKSEKIELSARSGVDFKDWVNRNLAPVQGNGAWTSSPATTVKQLMFHERLDTMSSTPNHSFRTLDLSWRFKNQDELLLKRDRRVREAILFARVKTQSGQAEKLTSDAGNPLPTNLWLGELPEAGKTRPTLSGQMNQETYIRVILPVRPQE